METVKWNIYLNGVLLTRSEFLKNVQATEVYQTLVVKFGFNEKITVARYHGQTQTPLALVEILLYTEILATN